MAIIWKSYGTVGPGSLGAGKSMPLSVVDKRLKDFRIFCHGERTKTMLPQSREHFTHIMVEVSDDDPEPRPERFLGQVFIKSLGYARETPASCSSRSERCTTTSSESSARPSAQCDTF